MPDIQHLIDTKQYYAAVGKLVLPCGGVHYLEVISRVCGIVEEAIKNGCANEVRKITRNFGSWIDQDTGERAYTFLNETTDIDLMPDEFDPEDFDPVGLS